MQSLEESKIQEVTVGKTAPTKKAKNTGGRKIQFNLTHANHAQDVLRLMIKANFHKW
jgi:hypothetical protein